MFEKIKKFGLQFLVLVVNAGLVGGGVSYFKHQQDKKNAAAELAFDTQKDGSQSEALLDPIAQKAQELQQIIDKNAKQKNESIANNPAKVQTQVPKTVTQTIPGATKTVTKNTTSSSSTPSPSKTTQKS